MKVKNFMTRQVVTVTPETSILDAARLMLDHKISGLPVVADGGRVVGIISEHDLLRGGNNHARRERSHWLRLMIERTDLANEAARFQQRKVRDAMTPDPVTIAETASLEEAGRLLAEHDIKRLPVVRDDKLVGVIARADIVRGIILAAHRITDAAKRNEMTDARLLELERQSLLHRSRSPT
ncbi:MAG: CBS domain-containing protein [Xanthobacteraceae bacterium]